MGEKDKVYTNNQSYNKRFYKQSMNSIVFTVEQEQMERRIRLWLVNHGSIQWLAQASTES